MSAVADAITASEPAAGAQDIRAHREAAWRKNAAELLARTPNDTYRDRFGKTHVNDGTGDNIAGRPQVIAILNNGALGLFDIFDRYPTGTNTDACQYEVACHLQGVARTLTWKGFSGPDAYRITGGMIRHAVQAYEELAGRTCHVFEDALRRDTSAHPGRC